MGRESMNLFLTKWKFVKSISLLDTSLKLHDFSISFQADNFDAIIKSISPNPNAVSFLVKGEAITFFMFIRKFTFKENLKIPLKLRIYDNETNEYHYEEIILETEHSIQNDLLPKLAIFDMMKRLETSFSNSDEKNILWSEKAELKSTLLEYCLDYEITENYGPNKSLKQINVTVPTMLSKDYLRDQPRFNKVVSKYGRYSRAKVVYLPFIDGSNFSQEFEEAISNQVKRKLSPFLPVIVKQNLEGFWGKKMMNY